LGLPEAGFLPLVVSGFFADPLLPGWSLILRVFLLKDSLYSFTLWFGSHSLSHVHLSQWCWFTKRVTAGFMSTGQLEQLSLSNPPTISFVPVFPLPSSPAVFSLCSAASNWDRNWILYTRIGGQVLVLLSWPLTMFQLPVESSPLLRGLPSLLISWSLWLGPSPRMCQPL
jgi:hypothetical protein